MTKTEFLNGLQRALNGRLDSAQVHKHVTYYQEYIEIQVRKGLNEEQVVEALGTPELIAKSILTAAKGDELHLDEVTLYSALTRLKSVCMQVADKAGTRFKSWFDSLK